MKTHVLGQINIKDNELYVYQFPGVEEIKDNLYFGHIDVMPFLIRTGSVNLTNIDEAFGQLAAKDILEFQSSKDPNTQHIFIKAEDFGKLSKLNMFDDENWKALIHPIYLYL